MALAERWLLKSRIPRCGLIQLRRSGWYLPRRRLVLRVRGTPPSRHAEFADQAKGFTIIGTPDWTRADQNYLFDLDAIVGAARYQQVPFF